MTWQWIAGFFEGEGCIVWHKPKKNSTQGIGGVISIGQKNKEPLQAIYDFLKSENFVNPCDARKILTIHLDFVTNFSYVLSA